MKGERGAGEGGVRTLAYKPVCLDSFLAVAELRSICRGNLCKHCPFVGDNIFLCSVSLPKKTSTFSRIWRACVPARRNVYRDLRLQPNLWMF